MTLHRFACCPDSPDKVDAFAGLDIDMHNGPLCLACGKSGVCWHCEPDFATEACPAADLLEEK